MIWTALAAAVGAVAYLVLKTVRLRARVSELESAKERIEGGLLQQAKEMQGLQEVTEAISAHPAQADVLGAIVSILAKSLEADVAAFLLFDETSGELVTQPGVYGVPEGESVSYRIPVKNDASSSARVFATGKPFLSGDAQNDPQVIARYARLWNCHSLMVVPMRVADRRIGVLRVGSRRKDFFNAEHLRFVEVIAEEAAVLLESATLTKKLTEMSLEMARLHGMKDEFVSTVSHEFKTPLTSIKGFLTVVLDEEAGPLTDEQRRFLRIAKESADRLSVLVSELLDLSRLENGLRMDFGPVELGELARQAVESHRWEAEKKNVRIACSIQQGLPPAKGDAQWLRQVLDNLLSNAIKFTPSGGSVSLGLADKGECLQTSVSDTGVGIHLDDQQHLFQKFYRARNKNETNAPGTGLGLAICKSIVERHEGRIWVESSPGAGTKFHFLVPALR